MATRRELIEAQGFTRRRLIAAFLHGEDYDPDSLPRRPNRFLYAGIVIVVLAMIGNALYGHLSGRAPRDWLADGNLVVDEQTSGRYVSIEGVLHPVPNLTSARLYSSMSRQPITVPHQHVVAARHGGPIGYPQAPDAPPVVGAGYLRWTACAAAGSVALLVGVPASAAPATVEGILVQVPKVAGLYLVTGGRKHLVATSAVRNLLGYAQAPVSRVPAAWLALVPRGPDLKLLPVPGPPRRGTRPGINQVGSVVVDEDTGTHYLVTGAGLRPFANRTSELLATGGPGKRVVRHEQISRTSMGEPFGYRDVPPSPPRLPRLTEAAYPCLDTSGGFRVTATLPTGGLRLAVPRVRPRPGVSCWMPVDRGTLVLTGPTSEPIDDEHRAYLVAAGVVYRLPEENALSALGYDREQGGRLPRGWLALLPTGPTLAALKR